jgi:PAS domain S-box-containing protein
VFANPRTLELVGHSMDELRERPFTDSIHPSDRALVADHHRRRLAGEQVEPRYEFRVVNGQGEPVWVALSAVMIDWDGRPATLSFISNVSERKRLQDSLAQTLFERETILQNSIVGIAFLDAAGRVRWANRVLMQMFRAEGVDYTGKSLEPFYPSREEYLRIGAAVAQAVGQGRHFETELHMHRANGEQFWAFLSGRAVVANDLAQGTVWVVMDITARKILEERLRASTEQYQLVVENVTEGMTIVQDGKFIFANPAFLQLLGYEAAELMGREFAPVVHPEDLERIAANRAQRLRGEAFESKFDFRALKKNGESVWVQVSAVLVDWHGEPATLSFISDITRRKQAEEDIQRSLEKQRELNHLKSRFVAMTSHEFRTPLATILSSAELLKFYGAKMDATERVEILDSIDTSVKRMTKMLDDVLLIGKVEAEKLEFVPKPHRLALLLESIAQEARGSACATKSNKPVHIESQFDHCDAEVLIDEKLLRHILGNLLSNAIKYSPEGGTVRFYAARGEQVIHLSVADQGIGLPPEDIPRLFENFFRASNVGNIAGTGLGLAIVKHAATQHGGTISVSSELGKGTTFIVNIPRQDAPSLTIP